MEVLKVSRFLMGVERDWTGLESDDVRGASLTDFDCLSIFE